MFDGIKRLIFFHTTYHLYYEQLKIQQTCCGEERYLKEAQLLKGVVFKTDVINNTNKDSKCTENFV